MDQDGNLNSTMIANPTAAHLQMTRLPGLGKRIELQQQQEPTKTGSSGKTRVDNLKDDNTKQPALTDQHPSASKRTHTGASVLLVADLKSIEEEFGKYQIFNSISVNGQPTKIEPDEFMAALQNYLVNNNFEPVQFIGWFYKIIDQQLFNWYFALNDQTKFEWKTFSESFISEVQRTEIEYLSRVHLNQNDFIAKIKSLNSSTSLESKLDKHPTYWYLIEKVRLIKLIYPAMPDGYAISMALCQIKDTTKIAKYRKLVNDMDALLFVVKHDDTTKN